MSMVEPNVMVNAIMGKLYDVLTNGDDTVPKSEDNFFSWCTPGIPFREEDFEFLSQGLTGVVKKSALDELRTTTAEGSASSGGQAPDNTSTSGASSSTQLELTPALLEQLRAQDTAKLYMEAENFARLVDFVPDLTSLNNNQFASLTVMNNEGTLSERYQYILRMSQVMESELPEETKKKIEKLRGLLNVTKMKKNLIDDTETPVTEPSPLVQVYNEKLEAYESAALAYNTARIEALAADNSKAVHHWAINANILRNRVKSAMSDWVSNGYKNDYEQISAFFDQVMQRDMSLLKQEYRDDLEKARLTGLASGSDFFFTSLVPGNFVKAAGWQEFGFSSMDTNRFQNSSYNYSKSSSAGGGGFMGVFGGGGSHGSANGHFESHVKFNSEYFGFGFKIAQVQIVRPWFKTAFITSKSWRFDQNNPEAKSEMVSDGGNPAKGLMPAYPTAIICIKDLWLCTTKSSGFSDFLSSYEQSSSGGGGYLQLGPFFMGGRHNQASGSGSKESKYHYDRSSEIMRVPGLQVIGFKCHILPKSPDPLSSISKWI